MLGLAHLKQMERDSLSMTTKYADSAYAKDLLVEALVKQSRYKEAADSYAAALILPDRPPCMEAEAAFADLAAGNAQKAAQAFEADRTAHPECLLNILGLARLRIDAGANLEALQLLQQVWRRDQGFFRVDVPVTIDLAASNPGLTFADFVSGQRSSLPQDFYNALSRSGMDADAAANDEVHSGAYSRVEAQKNYMAGAYASCAGDLSSAVKGTDAAALRLLSACSFFTGDYVLASRAALALQRASARSGAEALYWLIRANEKLAFAALARFQQLDPGSATNHILMGDIFRQSVQYSDAIKEYKAALGVVRDDPAALYGLAAAYLAKGDLDQAIETSKQALGAREGDPDLEMILGEALMGKHAYSEAKPHIVTALQERPQTLPHVHALLGLIDNAEGREQEAIREFEIGKASDTDGSIHYILARLYLKNGNKAAADKAFARMKDLKATYRKSTDVYFDESRMPAFNDTPQ